MKQMLERVLKIEEKHYGPSHSEVGVTLLNLACAHGALGDNRTKKQMLERALHMFREHLLPNHPYIEEALQNLVTLR